jgi:hypothetical protein
MKKNFLFLLLTLLAIQPLFAQVPSYVPTNGLVGYWPFNGNANDESGNGNNGVVDGAILTTDRNGLSNSAYSFDGVISHINIESLNNLQYKPITYSVWINPNALNTIGFASNILGRDRAGYYDQGALVIYDSPELNNTIGYYIGQSLGSASFTPLLNQWTLIAMTLDNNDILKYYINGILINTQYYPTNSNYN